MTMNTVFEKNMGVLEKRYPDLAKKGQGNERIILHTSLSRQKTAGPMCLLKKASDFFTLYDNDDPV